MRSKKRIFISLISLSLILMFGLIFFTWHLFFIGSGTYKEVVLATVAGLLLLGLVVLGVGIVGLVVCLLREKNMPAFLQNIMLLAVNLLFPIVLSLGKLFRIDQGIIKSSFIEVNNQLVKAKSLNVDADRIIILAPHCLQKSTCKYKITADVNNCRRCGACPINDLLAISEKYHVKLFVATGGTLARELIKRNKPRAIVAIACERDLTSGIKDSKPLPVLGILNIRPNGPCYNTNVNLKAVEEGIEFFLNPTAI